MSDSSDDQNNSTGPKEPTELKEPTYPFRSINRRLPEGEVFGTLTVGLGRLKEGGRRILMFRENDFPFDQKTRREFERFRDLVSSPNAQFAHEKHIVNWLLDGPETPDETASSNGVHPALEAHGSGGRRRDPGAYDGLEKAGAAVHKFGPVPVFVLPKTSYPFRTIWDGKLIDLTLAVHADPNLGNGQASFDLFPSDDELIQSLRRDLPRIMQRYLEDVGELFKDIENHAGLMKAFELCKKVEDVIGESLQSKLRVIWPAKPAKTPEESRQAKSKVDEWEAFYKRRGAGLTSIRRKACELYSQQHPAIIRAMYARYAALFAVNELYSLLGLVSRSDDYYGHFKQLKVTVNERHGAGAYEEILDHEMPKLRDALRLYRLRDSRLAAIDTGDISSLWQRRFVRFLQFLHHLRSWGDVPPRCPRVFISYCHDVVGSELLKDQISDWLAHENPHLAVRPIAIDRRNQDVPFRDEIKAGIWLSDILICIVPKETVKTGRMGEVTGGYEWLAREAEHARLLDKRVWFLVQEGANVADFCRALAPAPTDGSLGDPSSQKYLEAQDQLLAPLAPEARVDAGRASGLLRFFGEFPFVHFSVSGMDRSREVLDGRVAGVLQTIRRLARNDRHVGVLEGWFSQFPDRARMVLAALQRIARWENGANGQPDVYRKQVREHFQRLPNSPLGEQEIEKAITAAWLHAKGRRLATPGDKDSSRRIITLADNKIYRGVLDSVLRYLRPELHGAEYEAWREQILRLLEG